MSDASISHAAGAPTRWTIRLNETIEVHVWADACSESDESLTFENLVDVDGQLPDETKITARAPSDPRRMALAVAEFPLGAVDDYWSG